MPIATKTDLVRTAINDLTAVLNSNSIEELVTSLPTNESHQLQQLSDILTNKDNNAQPEPLALQPIPEPTAPTMAQTNPAKPEKEEPHTPHISNLSPQNLESKQKTVNDAPPSSPELLKEPPQQPEQDTAWTTPRKQKRNKRKRQCRLRSKMWPSQPQRKPNL